MRTIIAHLDYHTNSVTSTEAARINTLIGRDYTPEQWTALTWAAGFIPDLAGEDLPTEPAPEIDPSAPFVPSATEIDDRPYPVALNADTITDRCNGAEMFVTTRYGLIVVAYTPTTDTNPSGYAAMLADITSTHRNGEVSRGRHRNDAILGVYHSIAARQAWEDRQPAETGE